MLSTDDTQIWLEHLTNVIKNRKRGAAKVAATRKLKVQVRKYISSTASKSSSMHSNLPTFYFCETCNVEFSKTVSPFGLNVISLVLLFL